MASVSVRTITEKELRARPDVEKLTFVNLENSKPILYSFGNPLGHVRYDEGAAIKALIRHWIAIYDVAQINVLEPKYLISAIRDGKEKIIGTAIEKIGNKSLSDFVLAREPISLKRVSEKQFQLGRAADQFYEAIERLHKFNLYHGNPVPDSISVLFSDDTVTLKMGTPMLATSGVQQEEMVKNDKKRRNELREMLRSEERRVGK